METAEQYTNRLANETSPYLIQHAHNPVDWYPWGDEALEKAKREDKLLLVSIGYSACHWCHVMAHESFENQSIAAVMNRNFVCVKVDREERPDIDQIYMTAVQMITGRGGWPLNMFALPDGTPVYGGTYFRPHQWRDVLESLASMYIKDRPKILQVAADISQGVTKSEQLLSKNDDLAFESFDFAGFYENWKSHFDPVWGGTDHAPKFPMPNSMQFLLKYGFLCKEQSALDHVDLTLRKMAEGGIYDQIGGGFSRYSVDEIWKVPHFEKMLYDNAQLLSLYSEAFRINKNPLYQDVVYDTINFLENELGTPYGGFESALDADSEGVEGKFYVWTKEEIDAILGEDAPFFNHYYGITPEGNWEEGQNIVMVSAKTDEIQKRFSISEIEINTKLIKCKHLLMKQRSKRIRPGLDDKILAAWNGLTITGLADAYLSFGEEKFLELACSCAKFIQKELVASDGRMNRSFKAGKASINAFLDDYAFSIQGFISVYQITFEVAWLKLAEKLTDYALRHFYDAQTGMFFYTSDLDRVVVARKMELTDNVIPASNSAMAKNLYILGTILYRDSYLTKSAQMVANVRDRVMDYGIYHSNWANLILWHQQRPSEIVLVGKKALDFSLQLQKEYLPNAIIWGTTKPEPQISSFDKRFQEGKDNIYVCHDRICQLPVHTVNEVLNLLGKV